MSDLTLQEQQSEANSAKVLKNAVVIANVIELTSSIISRVDGKDAAYAEDKGNLSRLVLDNIIGSRIKKKLLGEEDVK